MSLGVLIVGLGQIGMGYDLHADPCVVLSHARAFDRHAGFRLLGGVDPAADRRALFEQFYGCAAFENLSIALARTAPAVVVIALPTSMHAVTLQQVLAEAQPQAILCEKPLAYDPDEAAAMVSSCAERDIKLYVNYVRRSDPGVIEVHRRIASGAIAGPIKGVCWYSKGFYHNGSHFFNLLEHWLGEVQNATVLDRGRMWDARDPEPDLRVAFVRGAVILLAAREEAFSHYAVELVGANGRLRYERGGRNIQWQEVVADDANPGRGLLSEHPQQIANGMSRYQWHVAEELHRALSGEVAHLCSGADALRTLLTMNRIVN